jgi:hypothetical protein
MDERISPGENKQCRYFMILCWISIFDEQFLGQYIAAWGLAQYRSVTTRDTHRVEVYYFPSKNGPVSRFATVGVSDYVQADGQRINWEFLMVVPGDNAGATIDEVSMFMLDFMAHTIDRGAKLEVGSAMDESSLAPKSWKARGLLIDQPRGEPEFLEQMHFDTQCVELLWLAPIHKAEYESIVENGLDEFDAADKASEWSLADPSRDSFI